MPVDKLVRASAFAAVAGGALLLAADLPLLLFGSIDAQPPNSLIPVAHSLLCLLGTPLLVLALPGLYLHQAEQAGRLGFAAFLVALMGTTLLVSSDWFEFFAGPPLSELVPGIEQNPPTRIIAGFIINFIAELLGWLFFGIATVRARIFPRLSGIMLIVGVLAVPVGPPWITMVWNGTIAWMGLTLLLISERPQAALSPETA